MKSHKRKLRVLIASHTYVVEANRAKIDALAKYSDLEVLLVIPRYWQDALADMVYEEGGPTGYRIETCRMFFGGHSLRAFFEPLGLLGIVSGFKPDLIHVEEEPGSLVLAEFAALKPLFGFKMVVFTWENILKRRKMPVLESLCLKNADSAIAGNMEAGEVLKRKGYRGGIQVIPQLGVGITKIDGEMSSRQRQALGLSGFIVGYVGRLVEEKGVISLVEAVAGLEEDPSLLVVGTGPARQRMLEVAASLGIGGRIVIVGAVPHENVAEYLAIMDVLVLPSLTGRDWKEQFGHVLIEAMAQGVPVIGSNSGAIPEVIADAGMIFREGDVDELRDCLKRLQEDSSVREQLQRNGISRVEANYTHDRIADLTVQVYRDVCQFEKAIDSSLEATG